MEHSSSTRRFVALLLLANGLLSARCAVAQEVTVTGITEQQVVQLLNDTVEWYRALRLQPSADEPSDVFTEYENSQTADEIVRLTFDSARSIAQALPRQSPALAHDAAPASGSVAPIPGLNGLYARRQGIQAELAANEQAKRKAKVSELQAELDLVNARIDFLNTLSGIDTASDAGALGASSLIAQIDAMAVALPSGAGTSNAAPSPPTATAHPAPPVPAARDPGSGIAARFGIWDLCANVLRLSAKASLLDAIDRRTENLQQAFAQLRAPLVAQLKALAAQGDALGTPTDATATIALAGIHGQLEGIATQFKQTSTLLLPLGKVAVLLNQYRSNLRSWHEAVRSQIIDALRSLAVRLGVLAFILALVFLAAELWHRAVIKYVPDLQRQRQLLLLRRVILWSVVVVIVGFAFASELGSVLTFAGLITAGVAVAMQSVLVSIVGYFFLVGKYGIRVGDRVQIGGVTGDVVAVGLVRLYLMELAGQNTWVHTGRLVAFANSIVFQVSGGLFKQMPGIDFTWHEIVLTLPAGVDYAALKQVLSQALSEVHAEHREALDRQAQEFHKTTASRLNTEVTPQAQLRLRFSATGVEALARYPVRMRDSAEIDEKVSEALFKVIARFAAAARPANDTLPGPHLA